MVFRMIKKGTDSWGGGGCELDFSEFYQQGQGGTIYKKISIVIIVSKFNADFKLEICSQSIISAETADSQTCTILLSISNEARNN